MASLRALPTTIASAARRTAKAGRALMASSPLLTGRVQGPAFEMGESPPQSHTPRRFRAPGARFGANRVPC